MRGAKGAGQVELLQWVVTGRSSWNDLTLALNPKELSDLALDFGFEALGLVKTSLRSQIFEASRRPSGGMSVRGRSHAFPRLV